MQIETKDSYEVAWYLYHYGVINNIYKRKVQENKISKRGYKIEYIFDIEVADKYVDMYRDGTAYGNVVGLKKSRLKIKKLIRKMLENK